MPVLPDSTPPLRTIALALVIVIPAMIVISDIYRKQQASNACHIAAVEWESQTHNGAILRAADKTYFRKLYASFRAACPNGHALVDERIIPAEVKAGLEVKKK